MPSSVPIPDPGPGDRLLGGDRNASKSRVYLVEHEGRKLAVKTSAGGGWLARWLLRREARIFAAMPQLACVPRVVDVRPDRIVTEWVDAKDLFQLRWRGLRPQRAQALADALAELHAAGFAHGDLGRHDILFLKDRVLFVDFATGVGRGTPPVLWRLLLPFAQWIDRRRVARVTDRYVRMRATRRAARIAGTPHGPQGT